ncbi:ABC transporter permease, partial [Mesorhizobium sp. M2E.F.Ca.ET.154.01.1.1]
MFIDQSPRLPALPVSAGRYERAAPLRLRRLAALLGSGLIVGTVLFFLVLPTLLIVPMSLSQTDYLQFPPRGFTVDWYPRFFSEPDRIAPTWFSLKIAIATTLSATV